MDWLESPEEKALLKLKQEVFRRIGGDFLDLSMINPDIVPPRLLVDRLLEASLKLSNHRYAVARGVRRAREGFATLYERDFGVSLNPETEVCVSFGTKDAMNLLFRILRGQGKALLLPKPTYRGFLYAAFHAGLPYEFYSLSDNEEEMINSIATKVRSGRFSALVLNFPNNPTGLTVSGSFYEALADVLGTTSVTVFNDFVYGKMSAEGHSPVSMLSCARLRERGVETYSLSKSYSVPGWRVGSIQGAHSLVQEVSQLKSLVDYGLFLPFQVAAASALTSVEDIARPINEEYATRMATLSGILTEIGWEVPPSPVGASLWAALPEEMEGIDSGDYVRAALERGVALTPGTTFGEEYGRFVRFALVAPTSKLSSIAQLLPSRREEIESVLTTSEAGPAE